MSTVLAMLLGAAITLALIILRARLAGFRAQQPADMAGSEPVFDLRSHLNGKILCEGMIYGPRGRVMSRFVADMEGRWQGDVGTLAEVFRFDSGAIQHRKWTLRVQPDGTITATAPDVVGTGSGVASGAGVRLRYRIRLSPAAGGHVLDVVDWMILMENGTIMNRSQFFKFGVMVAELVATMRKAPS